MYIWSNKILNLYDYIFQNENYEDTKDTSKRILSIRKCNELQWWNSKKILNLLDDVNICELNSYILSIFIDNLLNEDSKISFEFFQVFSQNKARLPIIVFLAKKNNTKGTILFKLHIYLYFYIVWTFMVIL